MEEKLACIRFNNVGKSYYFSTHLDVKKGDKVVVETIRGLELGEIVSDLKDLSEFNLDTELKKIKRIANRAEQVIDILKPYEEKLKVITDGERIGLHPLFPAVRSYWELIDAHEWFDTKSDTINNVKNSNNKLILSPNEADNDTKSNN